MKRGDLFIEFQTIFSKLWFFTFCGIIVLMIKLWKINSVHQKWNLFILWYRSGNNWGLQFLYILYFLSISLECFRSKSVLRQSDCLHVFLRLWTYSQVIKTAIAIFRTEIVTEALIPIITIIGAGTYTPYCEKESNIWFNPS